MEGDVRSLKFINLLMEVLRIMWKQSKSYMPKKFDIYAEIILMS